MFLHATLSNTIASLAILVTVISSAVADNVEPRQNLAIFGCREMSVDFCHSQIPNSVCNVGRDECACRQGYALVNKERFYRRGTQSYTCSATLTELACHSDVECIHVTDSVCHPGTGLCVCPGGSLFVPRLGACKRKVVDGKNSICRACIIAKGTCYVDFTSNDRRYGCLCPKTSQLINDRKRIAFVGTPRMSVSQADMCGPEAATCKRTQHCKEVDIGQHCTSRSSCRTPSALCLSNNESSNATCQCPSTTVAVYQPTLDYHECFFLVNHNSECNACNLVGGQCYDVNQDGIGDGCQCPLSWRHDVNLLSVSIAPSLSLNQLLLTTPCTISRVTITSSPQSYCITVCYAGRIDALHSIRLGSFEQEESGDSRCLLVARRREPLDEYCSICRITLRDLATKRACGLRPSVKFVVTCPNTTLQAVTITGRLVIKAAELPGKAQFIDFQESLDVDCVLYSRLFTARTSYETRQLMSSSTYNMKMEPDGTGRHFKPMTIRQNLLLICLGIGVVFLLLLFATLLVVRYQCCLPIHFYRARSTDGNRRLIDTRRTV